MKQKRIAILFAAIFLCVSVLTACGQTSLMGMLDRINYNGATPGDAYYAASYGNAYPATAGNAVATSGNAVATSGNAVATSGNAIATSGNAIATSGNAVATPLPAASAK